MSGKAHICRRYIHMEQVAARNKCRHHRHRSNNLEPFRDYLQLSHGLTDVLTHFRRYTQTIRSNSCRKFNVLLILKCTKSLCRNAICICEMGMRGERKNKTLVIAKHVSINFNYLLCKANLCLGQTLPANWISSNVTATKMPDTNDFLRVAQTKFFVRNSVIDGIVDWLAIGVRTKIMLKDKLKEDIYPFPWMVTTEFSPNMCFASSEIVFCQTKTDPSFIAINKLRSNIFIHHSWQCQLEWSFSLSLSLQVRGTKKLLNYRIGRL